MGILEEIDAVRYIKVPGQETQLERTALFVLCIISDTTYPKVRNGSKQLNSFIWLSEYSTVRLTSM